MYWKIKVRTDIAAAVDEMNTCGLVRKSCHTLSI